MKRTTVVNYKCDVCKNATKKIGRFLKNDEKKKNTHTHTHKNGKNYLLISVLGLAALEFLSYATSAELMLVLKDMLILS